MKILGNNVNAISQMLWGGYWGYNQVQKLLDCLSLFSSIRQCTGLKWTFLYIVRCICNPKLVSKLNSPFPTPCLNVALNIENGDGRGGGNLWYTPEWFKTFGPNCSFMQSPIDLVKWWPGNYGYICNHICWKLPNQIQNIICDLRLLHILKWHFQ